jgi:hypothetical protein
MGEKGPITPDEARTIPLPRSPLQRIRVLGDLATGLEQHSTDVERVSCFTRHGLVALAQHRAEQDALRQMAQESADIYQASQDN